MHELASTVSTLAMCASWMHSWRLAQDVKESQGSSSENLVFSFGHMSCNGVMEWLWGGLIHGEFRKDHHIFCITENIFAHMMYVTSMMIVQVRKSLCIRYVCWFVLAMAGDGNGGILLSGLMSMGLRNLERLGGFWQTTLGGPQSKRLSSQWSASIPAALTHEIRGVCSSPFLLVSKRGKCIRVREGEFVIILHQSP